MMATYTPTSLQRWRSSQVSKTLIIRIKLFISIHNHTSNKYNIIISIHELKTVPEQQRHCVSMHTAAVGECRAAMRSGVHPVIQQCASVSHGGCKHATAARMLFALSLLLQHIAAVTVTGTVTVSGTTEPCNPHGLHKGAKG